MKTIKIIVLSIVFVSSIRAEVLNIGLIEHPPHVMNVGGEPKGKLVEYLESFSMSLIENIELKIYPKARALLVLEHGDLDALIPVTRASKNMKLVGPRLFSKIPGLCFRKENFIPILSAKNKLDGLKVGFGDGLIDFELFKGARPEFVSIYGANYTQRSLVMLRENRLDAVFHFDPAFYKQLNPTVCEEIACSYFYGAKEAAYIGVKADQKNGVLKEVLSKFAKRHDLQSYQSYFENHSLEIGVTADRYDYARLY